MFTETLKKASTKINAFVPCLRFLIPIINASNLRMNYATSSQLKNIFVQNRHCIKIVVTKETFLSGGV